ncbi:MAG: DUF1236 domain-containing protein [Xanthobacteraceae bacterium]
MRQKHNMLLAGVAALALIAGGGIAAAQQSPQGQTKAGVSAQGAAQAQTPSGKQGGAAAGMEQHAQTSSPAAKTGQSWMAQKSAEGAKPENAKPENRSAQIGQKNAQDAKQSAQESRQQLGENAKSTNTKSTNEAKQSVGENGKEAAKNDRARTDDAKTANAKTESKTRERVGAMEKSHHERIGTNSRFERRHERMSANTRSERGHSRISERSKRQGEIKGLQGNASIPMQGSHVNLTSRQRNRIRNTVIDARGAPRVGHVGFDVTVGTLVPRDRVHVIRVPETLVRIDPQWHGYLYFVVEDQVVIVNPRDMRIVAVLDV